MPGVVAQTAPAPSASSASTTAAPSNEAVLLTPFEVSTDKDRGYAAGNTLSGGKLDTPLAITPASISVMTKQFMDDFAITNINEAASWTVGMDVPTNGNEGPFGGNRFQANFRGAGGGGNYPSRNGSLQYFVADSYNSERFEFQRGPNALLFGDAGAGGMQGSSSKQARFNSQFAETQLRGDTFGGYRATLDYNYGWSRIALRVNAVHETIRTVQDGTEDKKNGLTVAGTYKIAQNTQFRAEYERTAESNLLYQRTFGENASLWNRTFFNNDNTTTLTAAQATAAGVSALQNTVTNDRLTYNFGLDRLVNYRGVQYQTTGLGYQIPWSGRPDLPNFKTGVGKSFNLAPVDAMADRDANNYSLWLDHRFTPALFAQLGYTSSDVDPVTVYAQNRPGDYRIDINRLLPDGTPNPKFGKAYSEFTQNSQFQENNVEEIKAIVNYSFDVPRWWGLKQRLSVNGGWRQDLYQAWTRSWRRVDNPSVPSPQNAQNELRFRVYWDDPRASLAPVLRENIGGMRFQNVDSGFAADNDRRLTWGQIASSTTFLNERVAFLVGARRDKNEDDTLSNLGTYNPNSPYNTNMGTSGVIGAHGTLTTYRTSQNYGTVVYPFPESWGRWISPIGFVANYSENFSIPSTGGPLITGQRPSPPYAKTKDFGIRYSMPNGLAYATLTTYKTDRIGNIVGFGNQNEIMNIWRNLGYTDPMLTTSFSYRDTNDSRLEGYEFELTGNPTRNITFQANYSHPIVRTISESPGRRAYVAANIAEWRAGANANVGDVINGRTIGAPSEIAAAIQTIENSFNGSTAGTLANNLERHRINLSGRYAFTEGSLRGLAFTGGVNYRAHRKVGSRDARIKFQTTDPTVQQTVVAAYDYLWVPPTWQTSAGINYSKRFGKYQTRFQLNVTNLLNDDDPNWSSYSVINAGQLNGLNNTTALTVPGGNPRQQVLSGFSQLEPRKFVFTTTVSF